MKIYDLARKAKHKYKEYVKQQAGRYLSPVRRLERVAAPSCGRFVAMTFDDGPTVMPTNPPRSERGLTDDLLDTLKKYNAKGTFDVIGTTEFNYPDEAGPVGSFTWGGIAYDHYPDFGKDSLAGVKNQPELVRRILEEGHEVTNHGYRHILFGPNRIVYGKRKSFENIHEVIDDLNTLHSMVKDDFGATIKMSRPPHYVDSTRDGHNSYDAYRYMNYQYMAASFDGGGWQVSGDYGKDVAAMIAPLERALKENPDALNGQIIFQKDGCNMSKETPVADALDRQLELLEQYGYKVVTVSELIALSPFEDTPDTDPVHSCARALINAGYCVARKNNTLQPDKPITLGELLTFCANPEEILSSYRAWVDAGFKADEESLKISKAWHISPSHPYFHAFKTAAARNIICAENSSNLRCDTPVTPALFTKITTALNSGITKEYTVVNEKEQLTVRDVLPVLAEILL